MARMRAWGVALGGGGIALALVLSACSLLTSFDGFTPPVGGDAGYAVRLGGFGTTGTRALAQDGGYRVVADGFEWTTAMCGGDGGSCVLGGFAPGGGT
jgi:hypothetical protein